MNVTCGFSVPKTPIHKMEKKNNLYIALENKITKKTMLRWDTAVIESI